MFCSFQCTTEKWVLKQAQYSVTLKLLYETWLGFLPALNFYDSLVFNLALKLTKFLLILGQNGTTDSIKQIFTETILCSRHC